MKQFSDKLEMTGVVQMSQQHSVLGPHNGRDGAKSDQHDDPCPPKPAPYQPDHPTQPDHPSESGISVDLTNLLKGSNVDLGAPLSLGISSGEAEAGGLINIETGGHGGGLAPFSLDGETDALINVAGQGSEGAATLDVGSLLNAAMVDIRATVGLESLANCDAYDGNVPLAGDLSSALGATLDHLTTSSSLFDVPVLDILCLDGLDA
jgi:hypothetical protein